MYYHQVVNHVHLIVMLVLKLVVVRNVRVGFLWIREGIVCCVGLRVISVWRLGSV